MNSINLYNSALEEEKEEAQLVLDNSLTEEDFSQLHILFHELSASIKWGNMVEKYLKPFLTDMENVVFNNTYKLTKRGEIPFHKLFIIEQELIEQKQLYKNYIMLMLVKKLLGALKTRVNQFLDDIPSLTLDQEDELREIIESIEDGQHEDNGNIYDSEIHRKFFNRNQEFDEEEMDLIQEQSEQVWGLQTPISGYEDYHTEKGIMITADFTRLESDTNCHHHRTVTTLVTEGGIEYLREKCKSCRSILKNQETIKNKTHVLTTANPEKCEHKQVLWIKGKEGHEAICSNCNLHPVPDPGKYNWTEVGLEPYQDDPSKDEILNLGGAMSCES